MPRKKFVAGNWKMYTTLAQAKELAGAVAKGVHTDSVIVGVFPPFPWLTAVAEVLKGTRVGLGAQDCAAEKEGAFTGQVSAPMLLEAGCRYAIVGHSERRHGLPETDELLNRKIKAVLSSGLVGIFCIGELLAERDSNQTESVLRRQLMAGLAGLDAGQVARLAIAYEPVWAIGTGKVATDQQAQDAHAFVRRVIAELFGRAAADVMPIAYGGSVKPDNVAGLMAQPDVDGALVGGASLKADSFLAIVRAAA
jgi:triosephosphate isomerase (TIM)